MKVFMGWIKEGEEEKSAFENSRVMQIGKGNLGGNWKIIRKIRFVRLIRKIIEEGIIVRGMKEIYEEGWRILSEMERSEMKEEEEGYMFELYMMKVRGIEKNIGEDEMGVLRKEVERLSKEVKEEKNNVEEERQKRVEAEKRLGEANKRVEEALKKVDEEERKRMQAERQLPD